MFCKLLPRAYKFFSVPNPYLLMFSIYCLVCVSDFIFCTPLFSFLIPKCLCYDCQLIKPLWLNGHLWRIFTSYSSTQDADADAEVGVLLCHTSGSLIGRLVSAHPLQYAPGTIKPHRRYRKLRTSNYKDKKGLVVSHLIFLPLSV
jgi:hypothetical protein